MVWRAQEASYAARSPPVKPRTEGTSGVTDRRCTLPARPGRCVPRDPWSSPWHRVRHACVLSGAAAVEPLGHPERARAAARDRWLDGRGRGRRRRRRPEHQDLDPPVLSAGQPSPPHHPSPIATHPHASPDTEAACSLLWQRCCRQHNIVASAVTALSRCPRPPHTLASLSLLAVDAVAAPEVPRLAARCGCNGAAGDHRRCRSR